MEPVSGAPRFSSWITGLYAVAWLALMADLHGAALRGHVLDTLGDPFSVAARVTDRELEAAAGTASGWPAPIEGFLQPSADAALDSSISTWDELAAWADTEEEQREARARAALLLAQAGYWADVDDRLAAEPSLQSAAALLYGATPNNAEQTREEALKGIFELVEFASLREPDGWLATSIEARLHGVLGDRERAAAIAAELQARADERRARSERVWIAELSLIAAGALVGLAAGCAALLRRGATAGAIALSAAPWTLATGFGVLLRGDVWNRSVFAALGWSPDWFAASEAGIHLHRVATLIAVTPLVVLCVRYLRPMSLGLRPPRGDWPRLLGVLVVALSINLAGVNALSWISGWLGAESHWSEGVDEALLFGTTADLAWSAIDYSLLTPFAEELAFRGVLYRTLRVRFSPTVAAALSASLFAGVHLYSLSGFLATFWSGAVWCIAFERSRSLWPAVLAHGCYNAFYIAYQLAMYR